MSYRDDDGGGRGGARDRPNRVSLVVRNLPLDCR
jgi:hypothetical protein